MSSSAGLRRMKDLGSSRSRTTRHSIRVGEWVPRDDGFWALRIEWTAPDLGR